MTWLHAGPCRNDLVTCCFPWRAGVPAARRAVAAATALPAALVLPCRTTLTWWPAAQQDCWKSPTSGRPSWRCLPLRLAERPATPLLAQGGGTQHTRTRPAAARRPLPCAGPGAAVCPAAERLQSDDAAVGAHARAEPAVASHQAAVECRCLQRRRRPAHRCRRTSLPAPPCAEPCRPPARPTGFPRRPARVLPHAF